MRDNTLENSPCWDLFVNGIKTEATKKAYTQTMRKFRDSCKVEDYCDFKTIEPQSLKSHLVSFVSKFKENNLTYSSANNYLSAVELFLDMNEIPYPKKVIRKLLPSNDVKPGGERPYTTEEIKRMLDCTTKLRTKALILFFASIGPRPNAIHDPQLCLRHVFEMQDNCKAVLIYEGSKEEYWGFLTPEASKAYDDYKRSRRLNGEILTEESPMFEAKGKPLRDRISRQIMEKIIKKAGIERKKRGRRYDKALFYGFRKRFNTILKINNSINSNIVEKLMAHKRGLDGVYLKPTREECFQEFRKAIPELAIDQNERLRLENELQQKTISELQQKENGDESIKNQMTKMQEELEELKYGAIGRRNEYNQSRLNAPNTPRAQLVAMGVPLLIELLLPEEKKRAMMKEFEQAKLENRKPDLHKAFGTPRMTQDQVEQLRESVKGYRKKHGYSKPPNDFKPRFRIENLEMILAGYD